MVAAVAPGILFPRADYIDSWVYLGYMRHFAAFKRMFAGTYYGSRLSWLLPGVAAHWALPAVAANTVLHAAVMLTAVFALYWILSRTIGPAAGALTALLAGAYPYLWAATGWDYVDGVGIAYYLLTLALSIAAGRAIGRRRRWLLACGGAAYAALVYSNIAWAFYSPAFPAIYLMVRTGRETHGRALRSFALYFFFGWAAVSAPLAVVNYFAEGTSWFYLPSIGYSISTIGKANPWKEPGLVWLRTSYWVVLPTAAAILSILTCVRKLRQREAGPSRLAVFFAVNLLYSWGVLVYMEFVLQRPMLELWFYASYAIPATFLALGATLFERHKAGAATFRLALAAVAVVIAATWLPWAEAGFNGPSNAAAWAARAAGVALLICAFLITRWPVSTPVACLGLVLIFMPPWGHPLNDVPSRPEAYRRIIAASDTVERVRHGRKLQFWYAAAAAPFGIEFHAINSTYLWAYTWIGREFPKPPADGALAAGALLVVPSADPDAPAAAIRVMASRGRTIRLAGRERIEASGRGYWLNWFDVY